MCIHRIKHIYCKHIRVMNAAYTISELLYYVTCIPGYFARVGAGIDGVLLQNLTRCSIARCIKVAYSIRQVYIDIY